MRWLALGWLVGCAAAETEVPSADTRFEGTILTETGTTDALAVRDGVIVAVGADALAMPAAQVMDLGASVLGAGLHDSHTHLVASSFVQTRILLLLVSSMASVVERVEAYAAEHPDEPWLVGFGWAPGTLDTTDGRVLDAVAPDRPVLLISSTGHEAIANSAALRLAGVDRNTPDPVGGTFGRDPDTGELTGFLSEAAMGLVVAPALSAYDDEVLLEDLEAELETAASYGLTSIAEILGAPGIDIRRPQLFTALEEQGRLPIRVHTFFPVSGAVELAAIDAARAEHETSMVHFGGVKVWVDGSLGALEAWTRDPYATSQDHGSAYLGRPEIETLLLEAESRSIAVKVHAMGDAAVEATLDAMEAVDAAVGLQQRHTIEHASLMDADLRGRLAALGVIASVQPISRSLAILSDFHRELDAWPLDEAYNQGALVDAGIPVALGSDYPANPLLDPLATLVGIASDPRAGALRMADAWHGYTVGSGAAVGLADLGCMAVGCVADFTQYSVDPTDDPSAAVVEATWLGGVRVD